MTAYLSCRRRPRVKASSNLDFCVHWALLSYRKLPHLFWKQSRINPSNSNFFSEITSSLLDGLKQDKYDVVFCTKIDQEVDIDFTPVEKQDLVLIVPRNHPLANHHSIDLSETLPYPQVIFPKVLDFVPSLTNSLKKSTESLPLPMKSRKTKLLPVWYPKDLALLLYPIWSSFCG